jgi:hypothetical protein
MINFQIDEGAIEELLLQEIKKKLLQIESRHVFWSVEELCRQTGMSINNVKDKFFYDPRFPKYKVGGKWLMPAKECEAFLLEWIKEQPRK